MPHADHRCSVQQPRLDVPHLPLHFAFWDRQPPHLAPQHRVLNGLAACRNRLGVLPQDADVFG
jgi:hypothetical protein